VWVPCVGPLCVGMGPLSGSPVWAPRPVAFHVASTRVMHLARAPAPAFFFVNCPMLSYILIFFNETKKGALVRTPCTGAPPNLDIHTYEYIKRVGRAD